MATSIFADLKGIPIDYLVSAPLMAAARANLALAQQMQEFIFQVGYQDGDPTKPANTITFKLQRPYQDPTSGTYQTEDFTVTAPLIGLVTIPSLLVDNVTIDFTATVSQSQSSQNTTTANVSASYGYFGFKISGSVSTTATNTRSTDYSGKYTFHVQADQQPATEGMNKLMDVVASVVQPLPSGGGGGGK